MARFEGVPFFEYYEVDEPTLNFQLATVGFSPLS